MSSFLGGAAGGTVGGFIGSWLANRGNQEAPGYPKNGKDKRIRVAKRGYKTKCWIWRDRKGSEQAQETAWYDWQKDSEIRSGFVLVTKCGHQQCIRKTHLSLIHQSLWNSWQEARNETQTMTNEQLAEYLQTNRRILKARAKRVGWKSLDVAMVLDIPEPLIDQYIGI